MSVLGIASSGLFGYLTQNLSAGNNSTKFQHEFQQLGQDLQSGNLTAAQSDYSTVQQDMQTQAASAHGHHRHHHGGSGENSASAVSQLFNELGSALQAGNLSSAQQAYSSLQQDLTGASGVSVTA